jgi:hypothetical protein
MLEMAADTVGKGDVGRPHIAGEQTRSPSS